MLNVQSLHNHTTTSDGRMTHRELLCAAKKYGYSTIAFTDHDSVMQPSVIEDLEKNPVNGVRWISGIEISSALPRELGGGHHNGFHIIGLFVDPADSDLMQYCREAQEARVLRMKRIVEDLRGLGFVISEEDCLRASGGEVVGRPHVVEALSCHPENARRIEEIGERMRRDAENNAEIRKKYDAMIARGERQYPFTLFLSDDSHLAVVRTQYLHKIDMDEAAALIRHSGGKAVLAHYTTIASRISYAVLERIIREKRLDGVETIYGLQVSGTPDEEKTLADRLFLRSLVHETGCLESGGADTHREEELLAFAQDRDLGSQSVGLLERLDV